MNEIRFNHLEALRWLWGVLALAAIIIVGFHFRRRALARFADAPVLARLLPRTGLLRQHVRAWLVLAALPFLVAAMIDPRWGVTYEQVQQQGIDLVVVLDASRSMRAEDARPSRLDRAKGYIRDLVDQLGGDRVALVAFAGTATVKCPLTVDHGAFRLTLDLVEPETMPRAGSLLGDALRTAADTFTDDLPDHKAIIVFSDGEDHGSYPLEAARTISEERGIPIFTVGIGDERDGAPVPVVVDGRRQNLTHQGEMVVSKLDGRLLRDIAVAAKGAYLPVGTGTVDMARVYAERIEPMTKREFDQLERKRHHPQFHWFAGVALALLLIDSFIGDRRSVGRGTQEAAA